MNIYEFMSDSPATAFFIACILLPCVTIVITSTLQFLNNLFCVIPEMIIKRKKGKQ